MQATRDVDNNREDHLVRVAQMVSDCLDLTMVARDLWLKTIQHNDAA